MPRSRSFTRFTMRVGFEHFGQSVLFCVSMTFLRSPVLAIFAMVSLPENSKKSGVPGNAQVRKTHFALNFSLRAEGLCRTGGMDGRRRVLLLYKDTRLSGAPGSSHPRGICGQLRC